MSNTTVPQATGAAAADRLMSAGTIERQGRVLTTKRAAEYCGIAEQTLRNLLTQGNGPKQFKQGTLNAFYPVDLDAWLEGRITDPEAVAP